MSLSNQEPARRMDMEAATVPSTPRRSEIAVRRELGGQNNGGRRAEDSAASHSGSRRAEETVKVGQGGGSTSLSCEPDVIHILDSSPLLLQQVLN